jgi:hypothetical protein
MKPQNVLVDKHGVCKVHDFGTSMVNVTTPAGESFPSSLLSSFLSSFSSSFPSSSHQKLGEKTEIDSAGGNQYYMPPEVLDNWHPGRTFSKKKGSVKLIL